MTWVPLLLVIAAALEIGGDAAIRHGLTGGGWPAIVGGGLVLAAYGLVVNADRSIDFGRLMGVYIAIFFVVSQVVAAIAFGDRPGAATLAGGALIVAGGVVIQLAGR